MAHFISFEWTARNLETHKIFLAAFISYLFYIYRKYASNKDTRNTFQVYKKIVAFKIF